MSDQTPAEQLHAAAAELRKTAAAAVPGPWVSLYDGDRIVRLDDDHTKGFTDIVDEPMSHAGNAAWIALAHPGLAEPLAAWLEKTARTWDDEVRDDRLHDTCDGDVNQDCYCFVHAFAVARVILGTPAAVETGSVR